MIVILISGLLKVTRAEVDEQLAICRGLDIQSLNVMLYELIGKDFDHLYLRCF